MSHWKSSGCSSSTVSSGAADGRTTTQCTSSTGQNSWANRSVLSSEQRTSPVAAKRVPLLLLPIYAEPPGAGGPIGSNKPRITRIRPDGGRTRGEREGHQHDDPTA